MWESVKNLKKCAIQGSLTTGKSPEWHTCEACRGSWRFMPAIALQDKTCSVARQFAHNLNSWLIPIVRSSLQNALFSCNWLFTFLIHPTKNALIPTKCRVLLERILREKLKKKKNWLIHNFCPLIFQISLLSPSPLTYPWEVHLAKSLSHHIYISKEIFWCLGSSSEGTNSFWLMQWAITGFVS